MSNILEKRDYYKPFEYPWAYEYFLKQRENDWTPLELTSFHLDVFDWNNKLRPEEKDICSAILRFFTQADVDVASGYCNIYLPFFHKPEIRSMLLSFAAMEATHIQAYSHLIDTLGLPEKTYVDFTEYKACVDKHEFFGEHFLGDFMSDNGVESMALRIAILSAFGEGMQLFSSFALLFSFTERGLLNNVGQLVSWSIRDESLHVEGMIKIFRTLVEENPSIWTDNFKALIYQACRDMVKLEDSFIDLAFQNVNEKSLPNITAFELRYFIRYIANRRLNQLGLKSNYKNVTKNPFPWLDEALCLEEHANFFEVSSTEYSRAATTGTWEDAYA